MLQSTYNKIYEIKTMFNEIGFEPVSEISWFEDYEKACKEKLKVSEDIDGASKCACLYNYALSQCDKITKLIRKYPYAFKNLKGNNSIKTISKDEAESNVFVTNAFSGFREQFHIIGGVIEGDIKIEKNGEDFYVDDFESEYILRGLKKYPNTLFIVSKKTLDVLCYITLNEENNLELSDNSSDFVLKSDEYGSYLFDKEYAKTFVRLGDEAVEHALGIFCWDLIMNESTMAVSKLLVCDAKLDLEFAVLLQCANIILFNRKMQKLNDEIKRDKRETTLWNLIFLNSILRR